MLNLNEYLKKVEGLCIDYDNAYGHQCVDLIRHYSQNVLGFKLGVFGGSAKTGWLNKVNTFDKKYFDKVIFTKNGEVPESGSILFSKINTTYGHVSIVLSATADYITVLEQNMGNGNGRGQDDCVKISKINYDEVVGWYIFRKKEEKSEVEKLQDRAVTLGIFNGKDKEKTATRGDVALMCLKVYDLLKNKN